MTHDKPVPDINSLPQGHLEIDALLDGELVDKEALRAALDEADARDYLVDALLLRQLAHGAGPSRFVVPARPPGAFARSVGWLAASVILISSAAGGYAYGLGSHVPPATPSSSVEVVLDDTPAVAAPQPTHVIRFEPGVNWTSSKRSQ